MLNYDIFALAPGAEDKFLEAEAAVVQKTMSTPLETMASIEDGEEEKSRLLQIEGSVALITIKGGLTNSTSYWNRYFDLIAYDEIRTAVLQAVEAEVGVILFHYDTPGGRVNGMADVANLISELDVKTISFTDGSMASAGYFLASQSDSIYAGSFAEVGSIGVIIKLYDRSKYLSEIGIKPVRFRSGKLKAVGDGDIKLTAEEKKYIQAKVDTFADKFYTIVSDARGITIPMMDKLGITSGRTFIGEEALACQLVDSIETFDSCMLKAYTAAEKVVDKRKQDSLSYY